MQRYLTGTLALLLMIAGISSAAQIDWLTSLDDGLRAAKKSQQAIIVESYTDT